MKSYAHYAQSAGPQGIIDVIDQVAADASADRDTYWRSQADKMLERIERHSGTLLLLTVTASGGREYTKLNKLRGAGYVVKCDHPSVTVGT